MDNPLEATTGSQPSDRYVPSSHRDSVIAGAEVLLGAAVVMAHNVYHVVPNEVPILVVVLWASLLIRRRPWSSVGLNSPFSWKVTAIVAVCAGVLLQAKDFVTEPLAHLIWHQQEKVSTVLGTVHHSPMHALQSLGIVWTFAAFGEELAYRALLLRRTADIFKGSAVGYATGIVCSSVLFGFGHFYKGPTGVFDSTVSGLILAAAYLVTRRNLWAPILAHGLSDTFAVVFSYFAG